MRVWNSWFVVYVSTGSARRCCPLIHRNCRLGVGVKLLQGLLKKGSLQVQGWGKTSTGITQKKLRLPVDPPQVQVGGWGRTSTGMTQKNIRVCPLIHLNCRFGVVVRGWGLGHKGLGVGGLEVGG